MRDVKGMTDREILFGVSDSEHIQDLFAGLGAIVAMVAEHVAESEEDVSDFVQAWHFNQVKMKAELYQLESGQHAEMKDEFIRRHGDGARLMFDVFERMRK